MLKGWLECEAKGHGADFEFKGIRAQGRDGVGLECDLG